MKFVSIVGTQIMGTLQPWLSLVKKYGPDEAVLLYTTGKRGTAGIAEKLSSLAQAHNLGPVELLSVDYGLDSENSAPAIVEQIAREATGKQICFNLDGGMNYLISACVLRIDSYKPLLIQSSLWRCVAYDFATDTFSKLKLPEAFTVAEILNLQGVTWQQVDANPDVAVDMPLLQICKKYKFPLPKHYLENVRIDDIVFDLVWNPGNNRLRFLKDWRFRVEKENYLEKVRDFAHWGTDRNRSGQMFDKQIYVLTIDDQISDRLINESDHQLIVEKVEAYQDKRAFPYDDIKQTLQDWFMQKTTGGKDEIMKPPATRNSDELQNNTLVVCMGTNLEPTLLAICSHKPKYVLLCHTPPKKDDNIVCEYVKRFQELAPQLGVSITPVRLDIDGCFAEQALPRVPDGAELDVAVNVSPGSKGQGAMLALWAKRHGFRVWSLNTGKSCCSELYPTMDAKPLPFELCDPALCFRLHGIELLNAGQDEKSLTDDRPVMDAILEFMSMAIAAGKDNELFKPKGKVQIGKAELIDTGYGFRFRNGKIDYKFESKGKWLEKLMAVALLRAGAAHVRMNLATRWREDIEDKTISDKKLLETPHRTEIDVVGAIDGNFVLVSCKSYRNGEQGKEQNKAGKNIDEMVKDAAAEIRNVGASMGRFALRMLVHMHCNKAEPAESGRVMVLGWRDICQPEELRERIKQLRSLQSTSR